MIVLAMLIGGLVLLFVEVALIPGFGLTGVTGILVILAGLGLAFWKLDIRLAVLYSFGSIAALIGLVLWAIYIFPHTSVGKKFVLETKISLEDGYTATRDLEKYIGMEGVATSDLRPSGIARIGDERLDVLSDGEFVPRQSRIKVLRIRNGALIVGIVEPPPPV
ncbi:MAG TPA: NfeD family protein [Candidatus Ozemobacteraceae bacterium]